MPKRHSEAEMIGVSSWKWHERRRMAREMGVSKYTIYAWTAKYGGLDASDAQRLRQLGSAPRL